MASSFQPAELANGQVQDAAGALFTATADATYVKQFTLGVESLPTSTPVIVLLWLKSASQPARFWRSFEFAEGESADVLDGASSIILEAGSSIQAEATVDNVVDFWISGVEETFAP